MNGTDNFNSPFEKQLTRSARRLCEEQNARLPLRKLPRRHKPAVTWVASVAAACLGWVIGLSFPVEEKSRVNDLAVYSRPDTVIQYKERLVHDTVIQKVEVPVKAAVADAPKPQTEYYADVKGCNVECDGIDYAMLIGM